MKVISIKQPWAWLIVHGYKPVENRDWRTKYRGPVAIHASKAVDPAGYRFIEDSFPELVDVVPSAETIDRGGVVGSADLYDVTAYPKRPDDEFLTCPWFFGDFGFWLRGAKTVPFHPMSGKLGLFDAPELIASP